MKSKAAMLAEDRERACFETLRDLENRELVVIGGFALSAYGPPRFSVDLDVVISADGLPSIHDVLGERGFRRDRSRGGGGRSPVLFERWIRSPISVDILIDGVHDRRSGATFPYRDLRRNASRRLVQALASVQSATPIVAGREGLISLKLAAGRLVDLRDVAVLSRGPLDWAELKRLLAHCPVDHLRANAERLASALDTANFRDSLKGVYRLDDRTFRGYVDSARVLCRWALDHFG